MLKQVSNLNKKIKANILFISIFFGIISTISYNLFIIIFFGDIRTGIRQDISFFNLSLPERIIPLVSLVFLVCINLYPVIVEEIKYRHFLKFKNNLLTYITGFTFLSTVINYFPLAIKFFYFTPSTYESIESFIRMYWKYNNNSVIFEIYYTISTLLSSFKVPVLKDIFNNSDVNWYLLAEGIFYGTLTFYLVKYIGKMNMGKQIFNFFVSKKGLLSNLKYIAYFISITIFTYSHNWTFPTNILLNLFLITVFLLPGTVMLTIVRVRYNILTAMLLHLFFNYIAFYRNLDTIMRNRELADIIIVNLTFLIGLVAVIGLIYTSANYKYLKGLVIKKIQEIRNYKKLKV